ncbi:MAG: hypothetical protein VW405_01100, partial [Rhodospirillaceae bacterium]
MDTQALLAPSRAVPLIVAAILFIAGLAGKIGAAWGYGLLLVATLALVLGIVAFAVFTLTARFDTDGLRRTFQGLLRLGAWLYVLGVAALGGHFCFETLQGRMEIRWVLFGPTALAAIVVLDWGLYRLLVGKNLPTWRRFGHLVSRADAEPERLRRTLIDDVILHRTLLSVSGFRWFKHTLIFWGFALMFATEIVAVFVREGLPAFGLPDVWEDRWHPVRLAFDFAYDFTGLMVLAGCVLALGWRLKVNGTPEQKYTDTPTALFLFAVVLSGFLLEGVRLAAIGEPASASFVGAVFARLFDAGPAV